MARDILSEYGRDSGVGDRPRATNGGQVPVSDVHRYKPPVGPSSINDPKTPGIHGTNHGNNVNQGRH